ncbi:SHOCT domain-containing protein [Aeromicrobium flavum]|nr:SHOCT domain-containing protein [Aeromicrobium flavum]
MTLAMVAFWALVVVAVIAIFRGTQSTDASPSDRRDPMQILNERFARGEINEDEYHARSTVLRTSQRQENQPPSCRRNEIDGVP